jgi:phosphomevalonate kinase
MAALIELAPDESCAAAVRNTHVDSSALAAGGTKLGLGSSAAAVVATAAHALWLVRGRVERSEVLGWARAAHARAQGRRGMRGSGVDVIASAVGGIIQVTCAGDFAPLLLPSGLELSLVWSGQAADTVTLAMAVQSLDAVTRGRVFEPLAAAAARLIDACTAADAAAAIVALDAGRIALAALGRAAGLPLELQFHRDLHELAQRQGGVAKPTGAGGGDVAVAAFTSRAARLEFEHELLGRGHAPLDIGIDPNGVGFY